MSESALPRRLPKGANLGLRELDAELGEVTVLLDTSSRTDRPIDADVSVLLLGADGKVRNGADFVFYNQPIGPGGAVHLRDKIRVESDDDAVVSSDVITLVLDDVPDEIARVVVAASLDSESGATFGDTLAVGLRVQRTADAVDLIAFDFGDATSETALLVGEFYRRNGEWRVRAVGQGYAGGLAALSVDHGVDVAGESSKDAVEPAEPAALPESRAVSVRRPARAPRVPADWDKSIPAADGNDWQVARLFPVAGIGGADEQERRATSALLAVLSGVRDFGAQVLGRCGAPGGAVTSYVEVPFGQDEEAWRPDGLVRVVRGKREWTALVEVKTAQGRLDVTQIDHYVDIARARGFDAVVTISNELTGAGADHPVTIQRRKLNKVALVHLSWDQVRADATILSRHRGVADRTQAWVLTEFLRYMNHPRSGMGGMTDMGANWTGVRDAVRARTARPAQRPVVDVSARFDQLVEHIALQLSGMLGVDVRALAPRSAPDNATRTQQLADSGLLFGCLRVPGAVDVVVLGVDIRADRVSAAITVAAPRGTTRPSTRVSWLLRQLPDSAPGSMRIDAMLAGSRASTSALLGKLRERPELLLPDDQREIRSFRISLDAPMGTKRASGEGTLIASMRRTTTQFYTEVVQHLTPWSPPKT